MEIIFLYHNRSSRDWYDCSIEAWLVQHAWSDKEAKEIHDFRRIDEINVHIIKDPKQFDCRSFRISADYGKDQAMGHWATALKAFLHDKCSGKNSWSSFTQVDQRYYERVRRVLLKIISRSHELEFSQFDGEQKYKIRILNL